MWTVHRDPGDEVSKRKPSPSARYHEKAHFAKIFRVEKEFSSPATPPDKLVLFMLSQWPLEALTSISAS